MWERFHVWGEIEEFLYIKGIRKVQVLPAKLSTTQPLSDRTDYVLNKRPKGLFHTVLHHSKIILESHLPPPPCRDNPSEVFIITLFPDAPGRHDESFHEHRPGPDAPDRMHFLQPVAIRWPRDLQLPPAHFTELTLEEEVLNRFL